MLAVITGYRWPFLHLGHNSNPDIELINISNIINIRVYAFHYDDHMDILLTA